MSNDITFHGTIYAVDVTGTAGKGTAGSYVECKPQGRDTLTFQTTGTFGGSALLVQGSQNNGETWVNLANPHQICRASTGVFSSTIPAGAQDIWQVGIGGYSRIRIISQAAYTGTANIFGVLSDGAQLVGIGSAVALEAGSAVTIAPVSAAGNSISSVTAASTNASSVKASAGTLTELTISNPTATAISVKLYSKASAPTVGTDIPVLTVTVAGGATWGSDFGTIGKRFAAGIAMAATALPAASDTGVAVAGVQIHGTYL